MTLLPVTASRSVKRGYPLVRAVAGGLGVGLLGLWLALPRLDLAWGTWTGRAVLHHCLATYVPVEVALWTLVLVAASAGLGALLGGSGARYRLLGATLAVVLTLAGSLAVSTTIGLSIELGGGRGGTPYGLVEACP